MRTAATDGRDGITFRIFAGTSPTPIATWPTALTVGGAVCARLNFRPTLVTSGHRLRWVAATGFLGTSERIDLGADLAAQVFVPRTPVASTDQVGDVAAQLNFRRTVRGKAASGADGADRRASKAIVAARSGEAVPGRPEHSAIEARAAWEAADFVEAAAVEAAAADADLFEKER